MVDGKFVAKTWPSLFASSALHRDVNRDSSGVARLEIVPDRVARIRVSASDCAGGQDKRLLGHGVVRGIPRHCFGTRFSDIRLALFRERLLSSTRDAICVEPLGAFPSRLDSRRTPVGHVRTTLSRFADSAALRSKFQPSLLKPHTVSPGLRRTDGTRRALGGRSLLGHFDLKQLGWVQRAPKYLNVVEGD